MRILLPKVISDLPLSESLAMGLVLCAAAGGPDDVTSKPGEEPSGGDTTVFAATKDAFSFPARNITEDHRTAFFVGRSFFNENWVSAPASVKGREGLGPLFNTRSCSACHFNDGRSRPPEPREPLSTMLLRVSIPGRGSHGEPRPEPVYGGQIQGRAILGVKPEADVFVDYEEVRGQFTDGEEFKLRKPTYSIHNLGYGPIAKNVLMSPRVAPAMIGVGLLEAVSEETLRSLADPKDRNHDGISGRINYVWDKVYQKKRPGRFGWKAEQPSVRMQVATAFVEDIGITSTLMPNENLSFYEETNRPPKSPSSPEASDQVLNNVVLYSSLLAVPARRNVEDPAVRRGQALFRQLNCAACHVPELATGAETAFPELSLQIIRPYTDLLLHDMGEGLADGRPSYDASGSEWRTPPLWGVGLIFKVNGHTFLLHDGRARNLTEAILWHGGEAKMAREEFRRLSQADRNALIAFLESL